MISVVKVHFSIDNRCLCLEYRVTSTTSPSRGGEAVGVTAWEKCLKHKVKRQKIKVKANAENAEKLQGEEEH